MGIRIAAVALDYGNVLSLPPSPEHRTRLRALTHLSAAEFERLYTQNRLSYDRGTITGQAYWSTLLNHTSVPPTPALISHLILTDALSWSRVDERLLQWVTRLKAAGVRTAILSNIPSDVLAEVQQQGSWLKQFDVAIYSCEAGCVKPEPMIYHLLLRALKVPADQVLFIDDTHENVQAAIQLGLQAIHYSSFASTQQVVRATYVLPLP